MTIGQRIRARREELHMSQDELAKKIGYKSRSSINKIELDLYNLKQSKIKAIADALNTTPAYIMGWESVPSAWPPNRIKVLGSVPAGVPVEAIEDVVDWEDIPTDWLNKGYEYIGLRVSGDSMFPRYVDGDVIIIRIQPDCESGQDAVVYVNGYDATLKKVIKRPDGIMLQPINPDYEPVMYPFAEGECLVKILGIVVELRRKMT